MHLLSETIPDMLFVHHLLLLLLLSSFLLLLLYFHGSFQLLGFDLSFLSLDVGLSLVHDLLRLSDVCATLALELLFSSEFACLTLTSRTLDSLLLFLNRLLPSLFVGHLRHLLLLLVADGLLEQIALPLSIVLLFLLQLNVTLKSLNPVLQLLHLDKKITVMIPISLLTF